MNLTEVEVPKFALGLPYAIVTDAVGGETPMSCATKHTLVLRTL